MLYSSVETVRSLGAMRGRGVSGHAHVDWHDAMAFKRSYTSKIPQGTHQGLESSGIATVHGAARFIDAHTISVGDEEYGARSIVIATGESARALDIPGADLVATSTEFLDMDDIPARMVFIGGGYISFELANIAAAAGSKVTLIHHNDRPLRAFPAELVATLMDLMKNAGIDVRVDTQVSAVSSGGENGALTVTTNDGEIEADAVINATGREPNVAGLNLSAAGVTVDSHGIVVDEYLRANGDDVYAIGDVVSRTQPKLTPVAGFEGRYVAERIVAQQPSQPIHYPQIPTVVFGTEKLAQIGVSVNDARTHPDTYTVSEFDTTSWYTYNRVHDEAAKVMVIKDANGTVVGAATLSSVADDIINHFAEKLNAAGTAIYAYPTPASDMSYFQ
jgi:glutathione reductase (NADPH)